MTQHSPPNALRDRPTTQKEYGIPDDDDGLLSWSFVAEAMRNERAYWVATTLPDGRPHTRPVWGVWVDETFYCGGGEQTRWARNLAREPVLTVHRESGEKVAIIEGTAEKIDEQTAPDSLIATLDGAYEEKYDMPHGTPFWRVQPERVYAWHEYPTDATRWTFD